MELRQLRYLVAVADAGSFTAGARRAFVSQPTLSEAISTLEAELGVVLFHRTPRGATPTEAGRLAVDHARGALREAEQLRAVGRPNTPVRQAKLGLLPTLPAELITTTLARLTELSPAVIWRTEDFPYKTLRRRLSAGRVDAILTNLTPRVEPGHDQLHLATDTLCLAYPDSDATDDPVTPEVLHKAPLIVRTHCELLETASRILDDRRVKPLVMARTDSDARALDLVAARMGACLAPNSIHADGVRFVPVRPADVNHALTRRLGLEWRTGAAWLDDTMRRLAESTSLPQ